LGLSARKKPRRGKADAGKKEEGDMNCLHERFKWGGERKGWGEGSVPTRAERASVRAHRETRAHCTKDRKKKGDRRESLKGIKRDLAARVHSFRKKKRRTISAATRE